MIDWLRKFFQRPDELLQGLVSEGFEVKFTKVERGAVLCELPNLGWWVKAVNVKTALRCARSKVDGLSGEAGGARAQAGSA